MSLDLKIIWYVPSQKGQTTFHCYTAEQQKYPLEFTKNLLKYKNSFFFFSLYMQINVHIIEIDSVCKERNSFIYLNKTCVGCFFGGSGTGWWYPAPPCDEWPLQTTSPPDMREGRGALILNPLLEHGPHHTGALMSTNLVIGD